MLCGHNFRSRGLGRGALVFRSFPPAAREVARGLAGRRVGEPLKASVPLGGLLIHDNLPLATKQAQEPEQERKPINVMKTTLPVRQTFEFCFPEKDTLLRVEEAEDSVVIRATRDSFSPSRKASFVRELVAEGFISESYRWFSVAEPDTFMGVRWLIDISWLRLPETVLASARRFMGRILCGGCLLWVGLMVALFQGWLSDGASFSAAKTHPPAHWSFLASSTPPRVAPSLRTVRPIR